jgi:formylglycine-generating enzyme required for sulfatase activity
LNAARNQAWYRLARRSILTQLRHLGTSACAFLLALLAGLAGVAQTPAPETPGADAPPAARAETAGMVRVPAGEFRIGSLPGERWTDPDELPQRVLDLPAFYIDQFEVTNIDYKRFVDAVGWRPPPGWKDGVYAEGAEFYPVVEVTWWDAAAYARWAGKRLPTEEEWEKAARGPDGERYPWGGDWDPERANNDTDLLPAVSKLEGASPYGAVNMAGNAAEWTASVYAPYPRLEAVLPDEFGGKAGAAAAAPAPAPAEAPGEARQIRDDDPRLEFFSVQELQDERPRVYRGGSFNSFARFLRCANREQAGPGDRWANLGFRCALDAAPAEGSAR